MPGGPPTPAVTATRHLAPPRGHGPCPQSAEKYTGPERRPGSSRSSEFDRGPETVGQNHTDSKLNERPTRQGSSTIEGPRIATKPRIHRGRCLGSREA